MSVMTTVKNKSRQIGAAALTIIGAAIALEGGYVNHKADPGGETNMGITVQVARENGYTGPMRTLPRNVAESIYYDRYLVAPGLAPLIVVDAAVTEELFDTTVNMGPARPSRWFQQAINAQCGTKLTVDGQIGPGTRKAFADCQKSRGATTLCLGTLTMLDVYQRAEYDRLVRVNSTLKAFHKGWIAHRIGNVDRRKCGMPA
ncbi:glycoside hydrolase family 108 protein [Novosphingobium sp. P6W]|uniref:glycoside hydrolase family 108 protein n=1 Tax=Novosphingobium sp. P6W TaxID=1609758 RepID=UPI000A663CB9|nr:N-acetylmuramidase [Novosphingobium sp. P6W]AXB75478.1 secretion activating protein [Novosphingobium sp. P6W]